MERQGQFLTLHCDQGRSAKSRTDPKAIQTSKEIKNDGRARNRTNSSKAGLAWIVSSCRRFDLLPILTARKPLVLAAKVILFPFVPINASLSCEFLKVTYLPFHDFPELACGHF